MSTEASAQQPRAPDEQASEIMLIVRAMADEMSEFLGSQASAAFQKDDDRVAVLSSPAGEAILRERMTRLLDLDEWDRGQLLDLSAVFFMLAATSADPDADGSAK